MAVGGERAGWREQHRDRNTVDALYFGPFRNHQPFPHFVIERLRGRRPSALAKTTQVAGCRARIKTEVCSPYLCERVNPASTWITYLAEN